MNIEYLVQGVQTMSHGDLLELKRAVETIQSIIPRLSSWQIHTLFEIIEGDACSKCGSMTKNNFCRLGKCTDDGY